MFRLSSFFLLFLSTVYASDFVVEFDGNNATREQFPYLAAIRNEKGHSCSAVILNDRTLLMVASCDFGFELRAVVGLDESNDIYDTLHPREVVDAGNVHKSAEYYGSSSNKKHLAIVHLEESIDLAKHKLKAARLLTGVPDGHAQAVFGGWPADQDDTSLKYEDVELISKNECYEKMKDACSWVLDYFSLDGNICGKETPYQVPSEFRSGPLDLHLGDNKVAALMHYVPHARGCPLVFSLVGAYREFIDYNVPNVEWLEP